MALISHITDLQKQHIRDWDAVFFTTKGSFLSEHFTESHMVVRWDYIKKLLPDVEGYDEYNPARVRARKPPLLLKTALKRVAVSEHIILITTYRRGKFGIPRIMVNSYFSLTKEDGYNRIRDIYHDRGSEVDNVEYKKGFKWQAYMDYFTEHDKQ